MGNGVLSAVYTDGSEEVDVSHRLDAFVSGDSLRLRVQEMELAAVLDGDRMKVLLVKFETPAGIFFTFASQGELLDIRLAPWHNQPGGNTGRTPVYTARGGELAFIHAAYGNGRHSRSVMDRLEHYRYFRWNHFTANHEQFPSMTENEGPDYLLLVYLNEEGLHAVSCREGERICYSPDRTRAYREAGSRDRYIVPHVGSLGFGRGMDCSWAGALLLSLRTMGVETTYETVMGVSGHADASPSLRCGTLALLMQHAEDPQFHEDMAQTGGYLYVDNWPFALVRLGLQSEAAPAAESLLASLRLRGQTMGMAENRGYKLGYAGLEAWRQGLLEEAWYRSAAPEDVEKRYLVNRFCLLALTDARRNASAYLRSCRDLLPGGRNRELLEKLAGLYGEMAGRLGALLERLPEKLQAAGKVAEGWTGPLRNEQAELLLWVAAREGEADAGTIEILEASATA